MADLLPLLPSRVRPMLGAIGSPVPSNELGAPLGPINELGTAIPPISDISQPLPQAAPLSPLLQRQADTQSDLIRRENPVKPVTTLGKIGHVAAGIGNVLGNIFAPATMTLIPGTQLNNEAMKSRNRGELDEISQLQTAEAGRKQQAAQTTLTEAQPGLEQQRIDATKLNNHLKYGQLAAKAGQTITIDPATGEPTFADDPYSQAYKDRIALSTMHQATADKNNIMAEISQNHYVPGTPEYAEAQRKLAQVDNRLGVAMAGLGLSRERLGFQEDKAYNLQPTGKERSTGDMANSALDQIHTMRSVLAAHPEFAGPGAGATQAFQRWLSSNGEDAGKFLASKQYLADHSAAVFGGRGEYISKQMEGLTNPNFSLSTLGGVLDQAEETAERFSKAGQTHNKKGVLQPQQSASPSDEPARPANVPAGYHFDASGPRGAGWYK